MGKRSDFDKVPKDFYPTIDPSAITPRFHEKVRGLTYAEPCYGNGDLEDLLMEVAFCVYRSDIRETVGCSFVKDALTITSEDLSNADVIITNPPFSRNTLLPLLDHFISLKPTWLLLPADIMHNKYFSPYLFGCHEIISIGRLYWTDNKVRGKDNYCWFYWPRYGGNRRPTHFFGRE